MQGLALRCRELHCPGYFWKVCFPSQVCQQTHLTRQQLQVWHVGMHEYTHLDPKKTPNGLHLLQCGDET